MDTGNEGVEALTLAVEGDPTRNFSMFSISDDIVDLPASGGIVAVTEAATAVEVAGLGSIS